MHTFGFLPDALLETAQATAAYFENLGYIVKADRPLPSAPSVPHLHAKRTHTQIVILVLTSLQRDVMSNWGAFAKSTGKDVRVCCVLRKSDLDKGDAREFLRNAGFGVIYVEGGRVVEEIAAKDLGLSCELPVLSTLPKRVKKLLGGAYEQFGRSQWREGFEDACQAFEDLARQYLVGEVKKGRVTQFITKSGPKSANYKKVQKMTLGQLSHALEQIPNQTRTDAQVAQILARINRDSVGIVHHKKSPTTEKRLRKNVGMHMWTIVNGIDLLTK